MSLCTRHRWLAVALTSAVGLSTLLLGTAASGTTRPLNVVTVGDSFASGEGAIGSGWTSAACHRSALAGPEQAANRLIGTRPGTTFGSAACTGATTASIIGQLDSVAPAGTNVDALTISVGGNDVGFAPLVAACADPSVRSCVMSTEAAFTTGAIASTLPGSLNALFATINARPGIRNVFVTEYPDPTTGAKGTRCGTSGAPGFQGFEFIDPIEATFASTSVVMPLNNAVATAVGIADTAPGAHPRWHFVSGIVSRFATHGYCTGGGSPNLGVWWNPRFINTGLDSMSSQGDIFGSMHPNDVGQIAIADALSDAMSFLVGPMTVNVSWAPNPPVASSPASLTVQASNGLGQPVSAATVLVDGQIVGTTSANGSLAATYTFGAAGTYAVEVRTSDPYPDVTALVTVQGLAYSITSSPSPIPVHPAKPIPQLVLTTTDQSGAAVPGTFTLVDGRYSASSVTRTRTLRNGEVATNWTVRRIRVTVDPEPEYVCPTLEFKPDDPAYESRDVSDLIFCWD